MSDSLEIIDESILISDGEDPAVDLNDAEIAELLDDPVPVPEETLKGSEDSEDAPEKSEDGQVPKEPENVDKKSENAEPSINSEKEPEDSMESDDLQILSEDVDKKSKDAEPSVNQKEAEGSVDSDDLQILSDNDQKRAEDVLLESDDLQIVSEDAPKGPEDVLSESDDLQILSDYVSVQKEPGNILMDSDDLQIVSEDAPKEPEDVLLESDNLQIVSDNIQQGPEAVSAAKKSEDILLESDDLQIVSENAPKELENVTVQTAPVDTQMDSDDLQIVSGDAPKEPEDVSVQKAPGDDQLRLHDIEIVQEDVLADVDSEEAQYEAEVLKNAVEAVRRIVAGEVVRLDSDDEEMDKDEENDGKEAPRSRKRNNNNGCSSPQSPAPKRKKRRVQTYFSTRRSVINMITGILGSFDATLTTSDVDLVRKLTTCNYRKLCQALKENDKKLRAENDNLSERLTDERRAHAGTLRKLRSMEDEMMQMRTQIHKLSSQLTIPPTPEVVQALFPPPPAAPPHRMVLVPARPSQPHYQQMNRRPPQASPMIIHQPPVSNKPREFARIPTPTHTNLGHTHAPGNPNHPQSLLDKTDTAANTIMLCVPLVHVGAIYPREKPPVLPSSFAPFPSNPNLVVTINSTANDLRENWQIGGRINYEQLRDLNNKTIQVFVQVASFAACGMAGRLPNSSERIDWGCSMMWSCKSRSHRFRVRFHQQQQIPTKDRISVFAVARDYVSNTIEVSQPVTLLLE